MDADWEQKVRERAHAVWEREGRPENVSERHWLKAEEELRAEEETEKLAVNVSETVPEQEQVPEDKGNPVKRRIRRTSSS